MHKGAQARVEQTKTLLRWIESSQISVHGTILLGDFNDPDIEGLPVEVTQRAKDRRILPNGDFAPFVREFLSERGFQRTQDDGPSARPQTAELRLHRSW